MKIGEVLILVLIPYQNFKKLIFNSKILQFKQFDIILNVLYGLKIPKFPEFSLINW